MTKRLFFPTAFTLALLVGIYGCNSTESTTPTAPAASVDDGNADHDAHDGHEHADHDHGDDETGERAAKTEMEKMTETLASLSDDDRETAMKQHFCPVSGEMLGTMGLPEKVDLNGQSVWICCDGCKEKLLAEPETYLAKLKK